MLNTEQIKTESSLATQRKYATEVFTGVRPTGNLTVANYLGALQPIVNLQTRGLRPLVFVADIHAYTDHEPAVAKQHTMEVIATFQAAGLKPDQSDIFIQSDISSEVYELTMLLTRHITISDLLRIPTIKDKISDQEDPASINLMLGMYPVLMAADILLQRSRQIPTGQDQVAHLELTRKLAKRFNERYGEVLIAPEPYEFEPLKIRSLDGSGKMSKSRPEGAIFLTDSPTDVRKKISSAKTAFAGEMNEDLKSHILMGKALATPEGIATIDDIINMHMQGKPVMGEFKKHLQKITVEFLEDFTQKRKNVDVSSAEFLSTLERGTTVARSNARGTLRQIQDAFGLS